MIDQGEPQQMFADKILHDQRHNEAKNALIYIQEQHRDLMQVCVLFFVFVLCVAHLVCVSVASYSD